MRPGSVRPTVPTIKAEIAGSGYKQGVPMFDLTVTKDGKRVHAKTIQKTLNDFMKLEAALESKYDSLQKQKIFHKFKLLEHVKTMDIVTLEKELKSYLNALSNQQNKLEKKMKKEPNYLSIEFLEFLQLNPDEIDAILTAQDERMGNESLSHTMIENTEEEQIHGGRIIAGDDAGNVQRFINNLVAHERLFEVNVSCLYRQ